MKRDKKIRIVSFQNAHNFGAVLQAYSLQQTLLNMGYKDVMFLNYNPTYLSHRYSICIIAEKLWSQIDFNTSVKHIVGRFIGWLFQIISLFFRNLYFIYSRKKYLRQTSKELHSIDDFINLKCDVLICGSDQIWNKTITHGYDPVYFGKVGAAGVNKTIIYGASAELTTSNIDEQDCLMSLFKNLDFISVRELELRDVIKKYTNKKLHICLDPTLLCPMCDFEQIEAKRQVTKPYILVYSYYHNSKAVNNLLSTIPNYKNYEVHYILFSQKDKTMFLSNKYHSAITIAHFLSYFKYADFVLTDSFHGLCFSLIYQKNFNAFYNEFKNSRLQSLLNIVNLQNRYVKSNGEIIWNFINYQHVTNLLKVQKEASLAFLSSSLKS